MRPKHLIAILVLLALTFPASFAHAGGTVSICDETNFKLALVGGGTVTFACNGAITLTAEITITDDTTIDGTGQNVIISGNNTVRVFLVHPWALLSLNQLVIADGHADSGGAIMNMGNVIITSSTFTGNSAVSGGAIFNGDSSLNINNSTFTGNSAVSGGAIFNGNAFLLITNSTFAGNSASSYGGAIINTGWETITGSTFTGNSAGQGGAIAEMFGSSFLHFNRFVGNVPVGSTISFNSGDAIIADAVNNWWGSNEDPSGNVDPYVDVNPWLVVTASASPPQINTSGTSTVTVDLTLNSDGVDTSDIGHVPDGVPVSFAATLGTIVTPATTVDGRAVTSFSAGTTAGLADVQATVDTATETATILINRNMNVPTFSQWGIIIFAILLAASAFWVVRQRKRA